jgi:hypothetical protein
MLTYKNMFPLRPHFQLTPWRQSVDPRMLQSLENKVLAPSKTKANLRHPRLQSQALSNDRPPTLLSLKNDLHLYLRTICHQLSNQERKNDGLSIYLVEQKSDPHHHQPSQKI